MYIRERTEVTVSIHLLERKSREFINQNEQKWSPLSDCNSLQEGPDEKKLIIEVNCLVGRNVHKE